MYFFPSLFLRGQKSAQVSFARIFFNPVKLLDMDTVELALCDLVFVVRTILYDRKYHCSFDITCIGLHYIFSKIQVFLCLLSNGWFESLASGLWFCSRMDQVSGRRNRVKLSHKCVVRFDSMLYKFFEKIDTFKISFFLIQVCHIGAFPYLIFWMPTFYWCGALY